MKAFLLKNWMVVVVAVAVACMAGPEVVKRVAAANSHRACPACGSRNTVAKLRPEGFRDSDGKLKVVNWSWCIDCGDCEANSIVGAKPPANAAELAEKFASQNSL